MPEHKRMHNFQGFEEFKDRLEEDVRLRTFEQQNLQNIDLTDIQTSDSETED